jgi:hypothetical protein
MKKSDVKIGMKVVPFRKTVPGWDWDGLDGSTEWDKAKKNNIPYLIVKGYDAEEKAWELGVNAETFDADFFRASDFRLYVEK